MNLDTLETPPITRPLPTFHSKIPRKCEDVLTIISQWMSHQERLGELKELSLDMLVWINNTFYTQVLNRIPLRLTERDRTIDDVLQSAIKSLPQGSSSSIEVLEKTKIFYDDEISWRHLTYLGITRA